MADISDPVAPFGVGKVFSDAWYVFKKGWFAILLVFIVMSIALALVVIPFGLSIGNLALMADDPEAIAAMFFSGSFLLLFIGALVVMVGGYAAALKVTYNVGHGEPPAVLASILGILPRVPVLAVISMIVSIIISIGWWVLIVPGLWLTGVFMLTFPIAVLENTGFGALGRSVRLSRGYRWQILGTMALSYICIFAAMIVISIVGSLAVLPLALLAGESGVMLGLSIFLSSILQVGGMIVGYSFFFCTIVSIYQRVIDIKEGGGIDRVHDVFS
ncbi:MAG: hypothetical protein ACPGVA_07550 [Pikeienuella sp.]